MQNLDLNDVITFVGQNIGGFHRARLESLRKLKLRQILRRKNPYLFKAKYIVAAPDLVRMLLDAHLSSQEETMFGEFLEELAIFICGKVYNGRKSAAEGIDLEFEKDGLTYIVAIKSGPNWGNSSQIARMKDNFRKARRILHTNKAQANIRAINGCCYGQDNQTEKDDYLKLCGQRFWEFISGNDDLYLMIIEPLAYQAKEKTEEFATAYAQLITNFTVEFANDFCDDGVINWERLVKFNSAKD